MEKKRRELIDSWKNRRPDMGIISFKSRSTGEEFIAVSKDAKADINSNRFQLSAGMHPNERMSEIYRLYGDDFDTELTSVRNAIILKMTILRNLKSLWINI